MANASTQSACEVEHAEAVVRASGIRDCRVRHHTIGDGRGLLARIEVPADQLVDALTGSAATTSPRHWPC